MGKMKGQGYHYGKPEPANQVRERLRKAGLLVSECDQPDRNTEEPGFPSPVPTIKAR